MDDTSSSNGSWKKLDTKLKGRRKKGRPRLRRLEDVEKICRR
jgi:hypothetical protein